MFLPGDRLTIKAAPAPLSTERSSSRRQTIKAFEFRKVSETTVKARRRLLDLSLTSSRRAERVVHSGQEFLVIEGFKEEADSIDLGRDRPTGAIPALSTNRTSSATEATPSFCIILPRWTFTVFSAVPSTPPICL